MKSRIRTRKKSTREQTPDFSTAPAQGIFQCERLLDSALGRGRSDRERGTDVRSQVDSITERVFAIANLTNSASAIGRKASKRKAGVML